MKRTSLPALRLAACLMLALALSGCCTDLRIPTDPALHAPVLSLIR